MPVTTITTFTEEEINVIVNEIKKQLVPQLVKEIHAVQEGKLPPVLTRREFMEMFQIGEAKCAELFNREDFPVNREFGHPRIPTRLLMEWVYQNTDWVNKNAPKRQLPFRAV